jgi:cytochrome c biogenesis protein CcmG, thiol:disulfide interchange protein DsbE
MWKFLLPFAAFVALAVLFAFGLNPKRDIHALPSPLIGKSVPDFTLTDVWNPDAPVSNSTYKGQVYLVNVWGSWCIACREEHATLLAIAQQKVLPIVGIDWSIDHATKERDKAQRWLQQLGNPYTTVAFDQEGRTVIDFGVTAAPETFLIDGRGRVLYKFANAMTLEIWQREFLPRIAEARKAST